MEICASSVWVGDKKGSVYVFDMASLEEKKVYANKHSKKVSVIAANGKMVASGDEYRQVWVYDNETHEELMQMGEHKGNIVDLFLTEDKMVSVTMDLAFGVTDLTAKKFLHQHKMPHDTKLIRKAIVHESSIVTEGFDCAIRYFAL